MALIGTKSVTWRALLERAGITPGGGRFIGILAEYKTNARTDGSAGVDRRRLEGQGRGPTPQPFQLAETELDGSRDLEDRLQLEVHDIEVMVLTGIYSEETHLPQPLRISLTVDLDLPGRFGPESPLSMSKNYLDLKHAATRSLPAGVHFTLIEGVADHICETLFLQDKRVARVEVKIVKLAIAEANESIGITLVRHRR